MNKNEKIFIGIVVCSILLISLAELGWEVDLLSSKCLDKKAKEICKEEYNLSYGETYSIFPEGFAFRCGTEINREGIRFEKLSLDFSDEEINACMKKRGQY